VSERRLFVGIFPPGDLSARVHEAVRPVLSPGEFRIVPADEIHLTLRFLGATPEEEIPGLVAFLGRTLRPFARPAIRVAGTGAFPDDRSARVLWAGVEDAGNRLAHLAAAVGETKPYTPHLTVARCRGVSAPERFLDLALDLPWTPEEVVLVESRPGSSGPDRFPRIEAFRLSPDSR
jgi:2'-5' RNA ligase